MSVDDSQCIESSIFDAWCQAVLHVDMDTIPHLYHLGPELLWAHVDGDLGDAAVELCERLGTSLLPLSGLDYAVLKCRETSTSFAPDAALQMARFFIENAHIHDLNTHTWGEGGNTTLHLASFLGLEEIIQQLLDMGVSTEVENRYGFFPRDVAPTRDMVRVLSPVLQSRPKKEMEIKLRPNYSTPDRYKQLRTLAEQGSGLDHYAHEAKPRAMIEEEVEFKEQRARRQKEVALLAKRAAVRNNRFLKQAVERKLSLATAETDSPSIDPVSEPIEKTPKSDKRNSNGITSLKCKSYVSSSVFLVKPDALDGTRRLPTTESTVSSQNDSILDGTSTYSDDAQSGNHLSYEPRTMFEEDPESEPEIETTKNEDQLDYDRDVSPTIEHNKVDQFGANDSASLEDTVSAEEERLVSENLPILVERAVLPEVLPTVVEEEPSTRGEGSPPTKVLKNVFERKVDKKRQSATKSRHLSAGLTSWIAALDREFNLAPFDDKTLGMLQASGMDDTAHGFPQEEAPNLAHNERARVSDDSHGSHCMGSLSYNSSDSSRSESISDETIDKWLTSSREGKAPSEKPHLRCTDASPGYGTMSIETSSSYVVRLPPSDRRSKAWPVMSSSASMPSSLAAQALTNVRMTTSHEMERSHSTPPLDETLTTDTVPKPKFNIKRKPVPTSYSSPSLLHGMLDSFSPAQSIFTTSSSSSSPIAPPVNRRPRFGKLYLRVKGVYDLLVPLPKEQTSVRCVVSDGRYEYISRCEVLGHNVIFNYECLIDTYPDTVITVSLHVRPDFFIKKPFVRLFTSARKRKQSLSGYINHDDGAIGQTRFALSDMIHACENKSYEAKYNCFNAWYARTSRERQRQRKQRDLEGACALKVVGDFHIEMLYLSVSDPTAPLPKSLRECEMAIKVQQWNEMGPKAGNGQAPQIGQHIGQYIGQQQRMATFV